MSSKRVNWREVKKHEATLNKLNKLARSGFLKGAREHGANSNLQMNLVEEIRGELRDVVCYACFLYELTERIEVSLLTLKGLDI